MIMWTVNDNSTRLFQGDEIEFIIDPTTSSWNPNISDQNMHFIDTQTFLRRFIKIILTINCFNQIVINRKQ